MDSGETIVKSGFQDVSGRVLPQHLESSGLINLAYTNHILDIKSKLDI